MFLSKAEYEALFPDGPSIISIDSSPSVGIKLPNHVGKSTSPPCTNQYVKIKLHKCPECFSKPGIRRKDPKTGRWKDVQCYKCGGSGIMDWLTQMMLGIKN